MNEDQSRLVGEFLLAKQSGEPMFVEELYEEGVDVNFSEDISGLAVWRPEVEELFFYAVIGDYPPQASPAAQVPLQYNFFWESAQGAFCVLDTTGEELWLCRTLESGELTNAGLSDIWDNLIRSVGEVRAAMNEAIEEESELSEPNPQAEVIISV